MTIVTSQEPLTSNAPALQHRTTPLLHHSVTPAGASAPCNPLRSH